MLRCYVISGVFDNTLGGNRAYGDFPPGNKEDVYCFLPGINPAGQTWLEPRLRELPHLETKGIFIASCWEYIFV
jgi:hypothetical protein